MAAVKKEPDAFWEQMVNNEVAAKKALSPAAIGAGKRVRQQKAGGLHLRAEIYR